MKRFATRYTILFNNDLHIYIHIDTTIQQLLSRYLLQLIVIIKESVTMVFL